MKKIFTSNYFSTVFFNFAILFFIIGFGFRDTPTPSGWYQQFMPPINNRPISDITFLDSLTGFAVTPYIANDTAYILKTLSGGDNWNIIYRGQTNTIGGFNKLQFINSNTGYACGNFFWKTTNSGLNWFNINTSGIFPMNMYVFNQDTIWLVDSDALVGGVFRTTNGGASWTNQASFGINNPSHIYMFNARIGFIGKYGTGGYVRKTTDSGNSWVVVDSGGFNGFTDMYFIDSLNGWRANSTMKKTTDGGISWQSQIMPHGGNIITSTVSKFSNISSDTIWGVGGQIHYGIQSWGIIYRTVNGGNNWGYQLPDTNIHISGYDFNKFISKNNGWAYSGGPGVHTVTGGNDTTFTGIKKNGTMIPDKYILYQNYPNPFNPGTVIGYKLKVFDVSGKLIKDLVNQNQNSGEYEVKFDGNGFASGVYFYRMIVDGVLIDTKKMILLK